MGLFSKFRERRKARKEQRRAHRLDVINTRGQYRGSGISKIADSVMPILTGSGGPLATKENEMQPEGQPAGPAQGLMKYLPLAAIALVVFMLVKKKKR